MEHRKAKLIIGVPGGTAGHGAKTYKVSIPSSWVKEMGLGMGPGELDLFFDGEAITIQRYQTGEEFAAARHADGHAVSVFRYYDDTALCTTIYADFTDKTVRAENHTDNLTKTAFGRKRAPSWKDFLSFLEERCIPRRRAGLREYLEALGLDGYDPFAIIQKTAGRMAEDQQWIEVSQWP